MKKVTIQIFVLFFVVASSFAQLLDGYKYALVRTLKYDDGNDIYNISFNLKRYFESKGFQILPEDRVKWPIEADNNYCLVFICTPFHTGASSVGFTIKNCEDKLLFEEKSTSVNWSDNFEANYSRALKNCLNSLDKYSYRYDSTKTPEIKYPPVEKTTETEESIRQHLLSSKIDPIEGIYKSYSDNSSSYYKIGIIKQGDVYKAIIIESAYSQWKPGEVKAIFEPSSIKGLYSVKWYLRNKKSYETFGNIENDALLNIQLENSVTKEKINDKFIKLFPKLDISNKKNEDAKASGSGFLITSTGIVVTNAHVIDGSSNIQIIVSNETGISKYKSKIILVDKKNDVALLHIDDEKFKELASIPYKIVENSEVGSKVFTIGYPLNDIMGSNFKVTDGIISSSTGIEDDVRYYQISVPLQPGNSGGPLFNKDGNIIGMTSARLNSKAVGTDVENVNYAIKSSYILNLYNMVPNAPKFRETSLVEKKELQDQIKILKNYVCLIMVY